MPRLNIGLHLSEMLSNLKQCCSDLNKTCLLFLKLYKSWEIRLLQPRKGIWDIGTTCDNAEVEDLESKRGKSQIHLIQVLLLTYRVSARIKDERAQVQASIAFIDGLISGLGPRVCP